MSTVKAANLQNTGSGAPTFQNSSGTEIGQLARAWVNFDANGTPSIRDSFNVSSITDHGTGEYAANYSTAMPNANYCVTGLTQNSNNFLAINSSDTSNPNTDYIRVSIRNHDGSNEDGDVVCVCIHGD
jgi:hypothetical protein|tara:strand:- start:5632 stop:6015 length:384 start_codon:yes stop_codon:yes gene_type:complete